MKPVDRYVREVFERSLAVSKIGLRTFDPGVLMISHTPHGIEPIKRRDAFAAP